jgi:hypothetical protein
VTIHDAVKRSLPEAAPKPGAFRAAAGGQPSQAKQAKQDDTAGAEPAPAEGGSQE